MYRWISCNRLINEVTKEDKIFGGRYLIDPYQKCDISCSYCDAAEDTIYIKYNAPDLLRKEIKSLKKATVIIGSSTDAYQMIEEESKITREILSILLEEGFPVHILTKSNLVERDIDLLKERDVRVTFSLSTLDDNLSKLLEPNAPLPSQRLEALKRLSKEGIRTGVAIFPVIPFLTEMDIEDMIKLSREAGASHLIYEYLELKGDVKERFLHIMGKYSPEIANKLRELYSKSYKPKGYNIDDRIKALCKAYGMRIGYE